MGILSWIIFGLIVGALAKWLMPGEGPGGFVLTVVLGIIGAVIGGFVATRLGMGAVTGFDLRSIAVGVGGAVLLLFAHRMLARRRAH